MSFYYYTYVRNDGLKCRKKKLKSIEIQKISEYKHCNIRHGLIFHIIAY